MWQSYGSEFYLEGCAGKKVANNHYLPPQPQIFNTKTDAGVVEHSGNGSKKWHLVDKHNVDAQLQGISVLI